MPSLLEDTNKKIVVLDPASPVQSVHCMYTKRYINRRKAHTYYATPRTTPPPLARDAFQGKHANDTPLTLPDTVRLAAACEPQHAPPTATLVKDTPDM